jgi:hypothetical protein
MRLFAANPILKASLFGLLVSMKTLRVCCEVLSVGIEEIPTRKYY